MNSYKLFKETLTAFAVAIFGACLVVGCGKSEPPDAALGPTSIAKDKTFMSKLDEQDKEKRGIMKRFAAARRELEALRAKDPKSPRIAELEKYLQSLEAEHQANRKHTEALVREKLTRNLKK